MTFVSIGLRLRVDVEALNMVEPLGAYTRHRQVPLTRRVRSKDGRNMYRILMAPAVSGQSINNGYSRVIVDLAKTLELSVCDECKNYVRRGGFTKRATDVRDHDARVMECVVEDLTGFLAAAQAGQRIIPRRTSPVTFSYLVPDADYAKATIEPQFHVRYNFETGEHAPFTIESGSAVYLLSIAVDVKNIGRLSDNRYVDDRAKRIEVAFKGILALIEGLMFGAKKSRYLPIVELLGGVVAISRPLSFMVSKPKLYYDDKTYVEDTVTRALRYVETLNKPLSKESISKLSQTIYIKYVDKERVVNNKVIENMLADVEKTFKEVRKFVKVDSYITFSELISSVIDDVLELEGLIR